MPKDRKYPGNPNWRSRPRASGAGRPPKWGDYGRMVRISARWPSGLRPRLLAVAQLPEDASDQDIIDALVIEPNV